MRGVVSMVSMALMTLAGAWAADSVAIQPKELAAQLAGHRAAAMVLLYVGPNVLYRSKHISGAIYAGPANRPEGLELLKTAVAKLPRDRDIVLYCGCCPWDHCPNIRPAFELLRQLGFAHVRALYVPDNFKADWIDQGYPVE
jgi:3-mercaptopyruvate sulfurtransferase SseA